MALAGVGLLAYIALSEPSQYFRPYQVSRLTCFLGLDMTAFYSADPIANFSLKTHVIR